VSRFSGLVYHPIVVSSLLVVGPRLAAADDSVASAATDRELVSRALEQDRWAEEALYRRHVAGLTRTVTRLVGHCADAEDVVQETFAVALSRLTQLRDGGCFGGWLYRIALNLVRRRLRTLRLWRWVGIGDGEEDAGLTKLASPELDAADRAELGRIEVVLSTMGAELRMAWMLRNVEGWRLEEIASGLGLSLATTKRRLARADAFVSERFRKGIRP